MTVVFYLAHDSSENLTALNYASDTSDPPSRRNSVGVSDLNQVDFIESHYKKQTYHRI